MTLEIAITDTVAVADIIGPVLRILRRLLNWLKPFDDIVAIVQFGNPVANKSPPRMLLESLVDLTRGLILGGSFKPA